MGLPPLKVSDKDGNSIPAILDLELPEGYSATKVGTKANLSAPLSSPVQLITGAASNFDQSLGDWTNYEDSVPSAIPETGTGGSPARVSISQTAVAGELLLGTNSAKIEKLGGGTALGEGVSLGDRTVPPYLRGKRMQVNFKFKTGTGYLANHYRVFVYDQTNAQVLNVLTIGSDGSIPVSPSMTQFSGFVDTLDTTATIRLIIHSTTADATAFDIFIDDVRIGEISSVNTSISTDWEDFTPTINNMGTVTGVTFQKRREGPDMLMRGFFTTGTVAAAIASINIPDGLTTITGGQHSGIGQWSQNVTSTSNFKSGSFDSAGTAINFADNNTTVASSGNPFSSGVATVLFQNSIAISLFVRIPINEWSTGSAVLSTVQADHQTIKVQADILTATHTSGSGTFQDISWTETLDSHNAFDGTTFTFPTKGTLFVNGVIEFATSATGDRALKGVFSGTGGNISLGQLDACGSIETHMPMSMDFEGEQGDTLKIQGWQNTGGNLNYSGGSKLRLRFVPDFTTFGVTGSGIKPTVQNYLSSTTWTKPVGLSHIKLRILGGGGAGGGTALTGASQYSAGGGGGAGGYSEEVIYAKDLGNSETVTIGAGANGSTGSGANGGVTSFGSHASANGGTGGQGGTPSTGTTVAAGGIGGTASGGSLNLRGGEGLYGFTSGAAFIAYTGAGGNSAMGGGTRNIATGSGAASGRSALDGSGAGGSGAISVNSSGAATGGDGGNGVVIVEEFYL